MENSLCRRDKSKNLYWISIILRPSGHDSVMEITVVAQKHFQKSLFI